MTRPRLAPGIDRSEPASGQIALVAILDALERWRQEPSPDTTAVVADALQSILPVVGARGAALEIGSSLLPALSVGVGSLAAMPADVDRAGLVRSPLHAHDGQPVLGHLALDGPTGDVDGLVRTVEIGLEALWARAYIDRRSARLVALEEATRAVAAELDIDRVLGVIVDRVRDLVGARFAALGIADARGRIERFITSGVTPQQRAAIGSVPHGMGLLGRVIREGRTLRVDDIRSDPTAYGFPDRHPAMTSFLGAPVTVKGRSVGNLYLTDKPGGEPFTEDDEHLVEMFAAHAAIAIENARLHDQVQRLAVVEERERIGKDLHDGIIQSIYAVGLSLEDVPELVDDLEGRVEAIARVDRAIDALNLVIADIRSYILRLRPMTGGEEDPVESLVRLSEELGINAMIEVELDLESGADVLRSLPPDRSSDLLFIAREAFSNVARHSGATRTTLELAGDGAILRLSIEDNGRGFDPALQMGPDRHGRHQGLGNMRDRAEGLGGTFAIERPDGPGTRIIVRVPAPPSVASGRVPPSGPETTNRD